MSLGKELRQARERKGLQQVDVARILKITSQSLSNYERDVREPDADTLYNLAEVYEVSVDHLLGRKGRFPADAIPVSGHRIIELPVYGEVQAGTGGYALKEFIGMQDWMAKGACADCYMLKIKGDSMYPRYFPGDFAVVRPQEDVDSGDVAIVIVDGEEGVIKRGEKGTGRSNSAI